MYNDSQPKEINNTCSICVAAYRISIKNCVLHFSATIYRACGVDLLGLEIIMCGVYYCIMCTGHPIYCIGVGTSASKTMSLTKSDLLCVRML